MRRLRALVPLLLLLVSTLIGGCGGGEPAVKPTYTPEKVAQIQEYLTPILTAQERMPELKAEIEAEEWNDVDSFIHGPLGGLRSSMSYVSRSLLPEDQPPAKALAKEFFSDLERIDAAADSGTIRLARQEYERALDDLNAYIDLVPTESPVETETEDVGAA